MLYQNKREPFDIQQTDNAGQAEWLLMHGYEPIPTDVRGAGVEPIPVDVGGAGVANLGKRGKKDQPPADLSALADDLSKDAE